MQDTDKFVTNFPSALKKKTKKKMFGENKRLKLLKITFTGTHCFHWHSCSSSLSSSSSPLVLLWQSLSPMLQEAAILSVRVYSWRVHEGVNMLMVGGDFCVALVVSTFLRASYYTDGMMQLYKWHIVCVTILIFSSNHDLSFLTASTAGVLLVSPTERQSMLTFAFAYDDKLSFTIVQTEFVFYHPAS